MRVIDAARLMSLGYEPQKLRILRALDEDGVQAWYLPNRTLIIPGTNDAKDWRRNLSFAARPSRVLAQALGRGASGARWHLSLIHI